MVHHNKFFPQASIFDLGSESELVNWIIAAKLQQTYRNIVFKALSQALHEKRHIFLLSIEVNGMLKLS